ncbi:MAG: 50S ribosomal protein L37ae [Nanohaloarchaea archaeon SW_10_44_10]|nr:MAG: 50S ribosomal protein L37ae [Nanohaloarchaea archaeon SW_10_44_10]
MPRQNSSSKRFGARYGSKTRRNVDEAEKRDSVCEECGEELEREAAGIWKCTGCGKKTAGGAYRADTGAEEMLDKALQVGTEELEEAQEIVEGDE